MHGSGPESNPTKSAGYYLPEFDKFYQMYRSVPN
jgi:hypothetical protein